MRKLFYSMMLVAAAAVAFSCTKKEISDPQADTHTVRFHAFYDVTKTVMTETGTVASFEWTKSDEDCFVAFENGVAASEVIGALDETSGLMEFTATFSHGTAPYTYTAMLNGSVPATQTLFDGQYDEASDVLVAKPVESETAVEDLDLQFKRVVALNKMTIKGLGANELVSKVVINSDKAIAGEYDAVNDCWKSSATNTITLDGGDGTISDGSGNAVVYFNCIPVADAQLEITVTTDKATYTKTFAKTISLAESTLNKFGVTVEEAEEPARFVKVTSAPTDWTGTYLIVYEVDDENAKAFDGTDKGGDYIAATIADGVIAYDPDLVTVDIATMTGGYSIKLNGSENVGKFIAGKSGSNTIVFNASASLNTIAFEDGEVTITSNTSVLRFNTDSGESNDRFRYYKSTSTSFPVVSLYKLVGEIPTVSATGVTLDKTTAEIAVGATETLVATVAPADATNKSVTWTSSNTAVATVAEGVVTGVAAGTATITATTEDGGFTATCTVTVKEAQGLSTIDAIFDAATTAGKTATSAKVTFGNWVVSGVKNSNAYVTDGTKGFIIYQSGHGFEEGDILSGTVNCSVQLYNGSAELTGVTSTTTGITVTKGGTVTPQSIAISDLSGINTGAIITLSAVTYNGEAFTDGTNTITPYTTFITLPTLYKGLKYNVKGMYLQYNATREISPLSVDDIEEVLATKYAVNIASGIVNGTVTTNVSQAAAGQEVTVTATPASGYKLSTITVKDASSNNVTVTDGKFTMPASAVTVSATFEVSAGGSPVTINLTEDLGLDNGAIFTSVTVDAVTVSGAKGSNSNPPKYYTSGDAVRFYGGNTLTVKSSTTFKKITITIGSKTNGIGSATAGSLSTTSAADSIVWTGSSNEVTFSFNGTKGNDQVKSIVVE